MPRPLTILYEDEDLLFVNKPARILTVAPPKGVKVDSPPLLERLRQEGHRVWAVHRLDKETSGVVMLAKSREGRDRLMALFKERAVSKTYVALVQGHPRPEQGHIDAPIRDHGATASIHPGGQAARTDYRVLKKIGACALIEATPRTGRHNQIRLHFAHKGHALVGERKFARGRDAVMKHKRVLLHASSLELVPPGATRPIRVEAPLPVDFEGALEKASTVAEQASTAPPRRETATRKPDPRRSRTRRKKPRG